MRGQMMDQPQRRFIGPLQIVEENRERHDATAARQELLNIVEQKPLLQLGRQLQRGRHVWKETVHFRYESGELRRRAADHVAKHGRRQQPRRFFERFDPRNERWRSRVFVAPADQREATKLTGVGQRFFHEPALSHTCLAAHENQSTASPCCRLDRTQQFGLLRLPADQRASIAGS